MDANILLSLINTKLRDFYDSLDSLCDDLGYDIEEINKSLNNIGYYYDDNINQFREMGDSEWDD